MKKFAKPVKKTINERIVETLPKKKITFKKPANKPKIRKFC